MFASLPPRYKAILLALSGFLCFSITDAVGKSFTHSLNVYEINFWLSAASVVFFLAVAPWLGGLRATLATRHPGWHLLRAVLTGIIPLLNFYALGHMPLVNFYTIVFTAPFFTAIIARLMLGERTDAHTWFLIILGFLGVVIALHPNPNNFGWPELAVLASAIIFSVRNLTVVKMGSGETPLSYGLFGYMAIVAFSAGPVVMDFHMPDMLTVMMLGGAGILASVGIVVFSMAFHHAPSAIVAPTHYSQIIWGTLLGYLVFHDKPDMWNILGAGIVVFCGVAMVRGKDTSLRIFRKIQDPMRPPGA